MADGLDDSIRPHSGVDIAPGRDFRQEVIRDTDGTQTVVVFVGHYATSVTEFEIQRLSE